MDESWCVCSLKNAGLHRMKVELQRVDAGRIRKGLSLKRVGRQSPME